MKIVIVGAGVSGLIAAISLKSKHPSDDVLVIDHNSKISKKTYATGNGKCNLGNKIINKDSYNNAFAKKLVNENGIKLLKDFYNSIGIMIKDENNYLYPYSLSASGYVEALTNKAKSLNIDFLLDEEVIDYSNQIIITKNKTINYDSLVFATGGKSSSQFGSDGKLFEIFKNHGYKISDLLPGLCPIKTKEKTKDISGIRAKARVTLFSEDDPYIEEGEVLFKDDGLSGIVIFNISSIIERKRKDYNYVIELDLFKDIDEYMLNKTFIKLNESNNNFFINLFNKKLSEYILDKAKIKSKNKYTPYELEVLANITKHLQFTYLSNYDFNDSQVSIGGIKLDNLTSRLESKIEKNVYFIGEVVDIDGLCGGYNFMWASLSALYID